MCPHCMMVILEIILGVFVSVPVVGILAVRAKSWISKRTRKHHWPNACRPAPTRRPRLVLAPPSDRKRS